MNQAKQVPPSKVSVLSSPGISVLKMRIKWRFQRRLRWHPNRRCIRSCGSTKRWWPSRRRRTHRSVVLVEVSAYLIQPRNENKKMNPKLNLNLKIIKWSKDLELSYRRWRRTIAASEGNRRYVTDTVDCRRRSSEFEFIIVVVVIIIIIFVL